MYQHIILFIGFRYMCKRTGNLFDRFISWLSTIGITLGVMALIIVISVMNGFELELQDNILKLIPQVVISSKTGSVNPQKLPKDAIKLHGVNYITPLTIGNVILQTTYSIETGIMLGIDPNQKDSLTPYFINVKQSDLQPSKYNVILGEQLAWKLGVSYGDKLRVMVPYISQFIPIWHLLNQRLFNVIGIFSANSEVDNYQILVNIEDASKLMHYPIGNITGWRLWLNKPLEVDKLSQQKLPDGAVWKDWREYKEELFRSVRIEKNIMGLLLSLIIVVAIFNITTSLGSMVMDKQCEIAILQTQGLTPFQIMVIFILQGASKGIIGAIFGSIFGVLIANQINNLIPMASTIFSIVQLPVKIKVSQVFGIMLSTIIIALISTIYPSWKAAKSQPTKILRYE